MPKEYLFPLLALNNDGIWYAPSGDGATLLILNLTPLPNEHVEQLRVDGNS